MCYVYFAAEDSTCAGARAARRRPGSATSVAVRLDHEQGDKRDRERGRDPDRGELPRVLMCIAVDLPRGAPAAPHELLLDVGQPIARPREPLAERAARLPSCSPLASSSPSASATTRRRSLTTRFMRMSMLGLLWFASSCNDRSIPQPPVLGGRLATAV